MTKMVCLLLFAIGTIASSCPQLCGTTCTTGSSMCSSCYNSFESNSTLKITSTCPCPTGYYLSTSSNLCEFCPIFCASCINSSTCSSCIPGYEQNNNFNCVPILSNTNGWVGMNMSYDLTESNLTSWNLDGLQLISSASSTIINISQFTPTENYTTYCKLIQDQHFFGINLLGYNSQLFKTIYGLPPHGWAHVKFQFVAVDSWQGDSLILEISSVDTYTLSTFNNPMATFSKTFNSSQRFVDFCGSSVYSDNLGLMDAYFNHNNSMLALRIRTSRLGSTANLQLTFGVR